MANRNLRTCTTMIYTDGKQSVYVVMIGKLTKRGTFRPISDLAKYQIVGKPDYVAMTARHATVNAPAVDWQV